MTVNLTPVEPMAPCEQLARAMGAYPQLKEDSQVYRGKADRATADEESALTSEVLPEVEIARLMTKAQNLKAVYVKRIERKEQELARLITELETIYPLATIEFTGLLNAELDKRQAIVTERLLRALGADETRLATHEIFAIPQHTGALCEYAGMVRAISRLRPGSYFGRPGDESAITNAATALLDNLKQFKELTS
jgi:hypothetical protein